MCSKAQIVQPFEQTKSSAAQNKTAARRIASSAPAALTREFPFAHRFPKRQRSLPGGVPARRVDSRVPARSPFSQAAMQSARRRSEPDWQFAVLRNAKRELTAAFAKRTCA